MNKNYKLLGYGCTVAETMGGPTMMYNLLSNNKSMHQRFRTYVQGQ